jgi:hypothetical protein
MLAVMNNRQIEEGRLKAQAENLAAERAAGRSDRLAMYVRQRFDAALREKSAVEARMLKNLRQRSGTYESDKFRAIRRTGGSEIYMLITRAKCRDAEAWLKDVLLRPEGRPFDLVPTPVPEPPSDFTASLTPGSNPTFTPGVAPQLTPGVAPPSDPADVKTRAADAAARMRDLIDDQFVQGGWYDALDEFIYDVVTLSAGFIKGPSLRKETVRRRRQNPVTGLWQTVFDDTVVPRYERRSPFDIYPAPASCGINDGYLIDVIAMTPGQLRSLAGVAGFSSQAIENVLVEYASGALKNFRSDGAQTDTSINSGGGLATSSGIGATRGVPFSGKIEALEYWGEVPGFMLAEYLDGSSNTASSGGATAASSGGATAASNIGLTADVSSDATHNDALLSSRPSRLGVTPNAAASSDAFGPVPIEPERLYEACVWLVGGHVIKAMLNPDPSGKKPFSKASFEEIPGEFWGHGLPELLEDVQVACNATARAIVNNVGIASGPQIERNVERIPQGESKDVWPWKVWDSTDRQMSGSPALKFYQPEMVVEKLLKVFEFFVGRADEQSGIPTYVNAGSAAGAAQTASGLAMLITQAARGVKGVIKNIDSRVIADTVLRQYFFNLDYGDLLGISSIGLAELIPDMRVVAKGSSSLIAREQQAVRRSEFLQATNNPVDIKIIGDEGRRELLKEVARALEIDVDKVIPDAPFNGTKDNAVNAAAAPDVNGVAPGIDKGAAPGVKKALNAAGDPVSGADFGLSKNGAINNKVNGGGGNA